MSKLNEAIQNKGLDAKASLDASKKIVIEGKDASKVTELKNNGGADLLDAAVETKETLNGITDGTNDEIIGSALDVSSHKDAADTIQKVNDAINTVSTARSKLGAFQNRLEHTINNLNTSSENLQASESRIRDVDMAKEMMNFSKNNILAQAAQAMLAQANQQPQGVLQLLR